MERRCKWANVDDISREYHDNEWCKPKSDDRYIFEMLSLELMQAGLSWVTILKKRENFRKAFLNFDYTKISKFTTRDVERLLGDEGIIRNKLKINAIISNASAYMKVLEEYGSFNKYIFTFTDRINNSWKDETFVPAKTDLSDRISKDMKKRGFKFVGSTIIYSFLQSIGIIDDHIEDCCIKNRL